MSRCPPERDNQSTGPASTSPAFATAIESPSAFPTPAGSFPPVERNSGQREGETMDAFFQRRRQNVSTRALRETPQERKSRQQRETHAAKGAAPGKKGARVYVWEKSNGHYVRRAVGRNNQDDIWEEYGPCQRRYDSYYDEWDICEEFGPPSDADDDDDDFGIYLPYEQPTDSKSQSYSVDVPSRDNGPPDVDTFARRKQAETDLDLPITAVAKKFLGDSDLQISHETQFQNFRAFLAHCAKAKHPRDIPVTLLDFHQQDAELLSDWMVRVRRETLNGRLYYVISEAQDTLGLYVLLQSAVTTLEVVRQGWGPSMRDVMQHLLSRGVPFLTCFRSTEIPTGKPQGRNWYSGLGFRPANYTPNRLDYQSYTWHRDNFLRGPRGRAALLYGGVIGRLARTVVSEDEVLRGPSDAATIDGICLWDGHAQSAYWDDTLSEREIDLICGVYHVATGR
ncbi:hypothetical protein B0H15DRAFT_781295 [Mycena belliarum]|uniref:Uncharacterized protein n=1 Tax=Mycena belliarum TaxID=1033014 RepID=A0AAD6XNQ0_9AGAR|nr:hypothetical protein B0H15DRAFT_781295 [Mycena belliae]